MPYEIRYSAEALAELRRLRKFDATAILDHIERVLTVNPTLESKARVKKLRQPAPTQYRLRVGEHRIFYDVEAEHVNVIRILSKPSLTWGVINMAVETISHNETHLTALLDKARGEPVILKAASSGEFALLPLDDEVIDLLLERHPKFIAECGEIRRRMQHGVYYTHDQVLAALRDEPNKERK